jgi:energy-coupling factor transporter ATP-binding protein EcfA2
LIKETNIEHWFGPNISNITAVIGKNGAGKSNMIECLINALCYQSGGIVIFKYKSNLYTNLDSRDYIFPSEIHRMSRGGSPLDAEFQEHVNDAAVIYYSPTIDRRISGNNYHCFTDISNAFLLRTAQQNSFNSIPDFAKSADVDYMQLVDTFRLMLFFIYTKKYKLKIPEDLRRPQYLNISLFLYGNEPADKNYQKIKSECDDTFPGKLKYFMLWQFYMSKALPKDKEMSFDNIILFFNHNEPVRPNMYNLLVELYKNDPLAELNSLNNDV